MNPTIRRLSACMLIFAGLAMLHVYSAAASHIAITFLVVMTGIVQIKRVGFKVRYLMCIAVGILFFLSSPAVSNTGHAAFIINMVGFNAAILLGLYLFFHRRLKAEGSHAMHKAVIGIAIAFVIAADLVSAYLLLNGRV